MRTLADFLSWCDDAPAGTTLSPAQVAATLRELSEVPEPGPEPPTLMIHTAEKPSWRERLWSAPDETRLNLVELCEALGKSRTWVYRDGFRRGLPRRRDASGHLVFIVEEVRQWLRKQEMVIIPGSLARAQYR